MTKKTHQRELDRARAKRQADAYGRRQKRVRIISIVLIFALAGAVVVAAALSRNGDEPAADPVAADACPAPTADTPASPLKSYDAAPEMAIDPTAAYSATIVTTCGTIELSLDAAGAPVTVNNFVFLARDGYYVGAPFHRVIDEFMIQGGDPSGTGSGDGGTYPGYTFADELTTAQEIVNEFGGYPRGKLAMANAGPDTNGSQFFIMQVKALPAYGLDPNYTVFGEVTSGMDVVDRIVKVPASGGLAIEPVIILSIEIHES